jgi:hypothetical protein
MSTSSRSTDGAYKDHSAKTNSESPQAAGSAETQGDAAGTIDYLDIPAFLRRQAD